MLKTGEMASAKQTASVARRMNEYKPKTPMGGQAGRPGAGSIRGPKKSCMYRGALRWNRGWALHSCLASANDASSITVVLRTDIEMDSLHFFSSSIVVTYSLLLDSTSCRNGILAPGQKARKPESQTRIATRSRDYPPPNPPVRPLH